ncbi:MAG: glucose-6-phosphate dehydrogenase assembly protein OpcA [Acidobacteria bacterium]|nr:glucose-6-phosphate dehydrogenase assembly protein OpcA [Acidobacteriota bacterium]
METQAGTGSIPSARGIDAGKLEKELAAKWASETDAKSDGATAGVTRACVLNLIVYTTSLEGRDEVDALLDELVARHPSRALVLVVDREATEAKLEASASTRCHSSAKGAKQICGEQVTVEAAGPAVENVSTAVAPLLVTDVPVFLWWKDIPHYEDKLFDRLSELADRVVIDSASFDHPHDDLNRLAQLLADRERPAVISDLNWGRLTAWRSLVASFWDVADYKQSLGQIERVVLEYERPEKAPGEISPKALLAVGWMASRLGWELEPSVIRLKEDSASFGFRSGERSIEVALRPTKSTKRQCGMLTSLTISCAEGGEFYVGLKPEGTKLETVAQIGGRERSVGRVLNYEARTEGQRLSSELEILSRDLVYEEAVQSAARLLERLER